MRGRSSEEEWWGGVRERCEGGDVRGCEGEE